MDLLTNDSKYGPYIDVKSQDWRWWYKHIFKFSLSELFSPKNISLVRMCEILYCKPCKLITEPRREFHEPPDVKPRVGDGGNVQSDVSWYSLHAYRKVFNQHTYIEIHRNKEPIETEPRAAGWKVFHLYICLVDSPCFMPGRRVDLTGRSDGHLVANWAPEVAWVKSPPTTRKSAR